MTCPQIEQEIATQDTMQKLNEGRASELRAGYYAYQTATLIPFVGGVIGAVDAVGDFSHGQELDHLNAAAGNARRRREYLQQMQAGRCPATAPG